MSKLVLVMGLPGSGKSEFSKTLKGKKLHVDEFRKTITGSYIPKGEDDLFVYRMVQTTARYYLEQGRTVIIDGALLTKKSRRMYLELARKNPTMVELYWMNPTIKTIKARLLERNKKVEEDRKISDAYLERMLKIVDVPTKDEGIDVIHYITDEE